MISLEGLYTDDENNTLNDLPLSLDNWSASLWLYRIRC